MSNITEILRNARGFHSLSGVSQHDIEESERELSLKFANEYREYVAAYGIASVYGHEFTGVCKFPRLSVVEVTLSERKTNPSIPLDWYVLEQAHIDGIVIWQSGTGEVFRTAPNTAPVKLCESLADYLDL